MDHDELNRLRTEADRRWRRRMVLMVVLIVAWVPIGAVITFLGSGSRRSVPWGLLAATMGAAVGLMLIMLAVVLLVQRWRTGRWGPAPLAVGGTKASVRRAVFRAVRRGELPGSQPERTLAEELARRTVAQRWVPWWSSATALLVATNATFQITEGHRTIGVTTLCSAVAFAALTVLSLQRRRGARRLLAASNSAHDDH